MNLPRLSELPQWSDFRRVGLDIETRDPDLKKTGPGVRRDGYITGVSFCFGDEHGPAFYLPMRHEAGGNYDEPERVLEYLREQAKYFRGEIVGTNLSYDLDYLAEADVHYAHASFRDIQVSGPLLDEPMLVRIQDKTTGRWFWGEDYHYMNLNAQAERLGVPGKDDAGLEAWAAEHGLDPKADMWKAPAGIVAPYAIQDVRLPLQISAAHEIEIARQDLDQVYDVESRLLPVLLKMRRRGVAVDMKRVEQIGAEAWSLENEACREVTRLTGREMSPDDTSKSAALALILRASGVTEIPKTEEKLSQKTGKMTGGNDSVTSPWLRTLGTPLATAILAAKRWNKVRTTFCQSMKDHEIKGRIHCTFNQLRQERDDGDIKGSAFGRLSSTGPNLQQQPIRDVPEWRTIFLPDDGGEWACLDFSSQEPRLITHYAELTGCRGGAEAAEACRTDPHWDNHSAMAGFINGDDYSAEAYRDGDSRMKALRTDAKTIFLGRCLGKGTLVHTDKGRKPIESVTIEDRLWDGLEFVSHNGVVRTGEKACIKIAGVWMTPTHEIMTPEGWFQAQDLSTRSPQSGWCMEALPLNGSSWVREGGSSPSSAVAPVVDALLQAGTIWSPANRHAVLSVVTKRFLRHLHDTATCQIPIVKDFLTGFTQSSVAALHARTRVMASGASQCMPLGLEIDMRFSDTWSHFRGGITRALKLTEKTTTAITSPEISALLPNRRTCVIETFDVMDAGPRNRFCVGDGMVVSNCYGMGGGKLSRSLGLPTVWVVRDPYAPRWTTYPVDSELGKALQKNAGARPFEMAGPEGQVILNKFDRGVPYVKQLAKMVQNRAYKKGFITTLLGRRRRFPIHPETGKLWDGHKALNNLIQGGAADQTKLAMVLADEAGVRLQLQVHDELDLTIWDRKEAALLEEIMVAAIPLNVPTLVDIETGANWGTIA